MEVGQKIYLKPTGNASRRSTDIIETTVTKVGRKFIEVEYPGCDKIYIDSLTEYSNFTADYQAYFSKKEIEDEKEANQLHRLIKKNLGEYSPQHPLSTLRKIAEVMELKTDQL